MRLLSLSFLLFTSLLSLGQEPDSQVHSVYFELDQHEIQSQESNKLIAWLETLPDSVKKLEIIGYADFLGSSDYNDKLSAKRAAGVMKLIEKSESMRYRMSLVSSVGEDESSDNGSSNGVPSNRVVKVIVWPYPAKQASEPAKEVEEVERERPQESIAAELLETAEVGQSIVFGNLNFFPGRHFLVPQALPELEELIESLKRNANIEIEIIGHICCKLDSIDGLDVNTRTYTLSANRAKYIHDQLVLAGISASRLSHRGLAGSRPLVVPEITDKDRARNRRVEIKVTAK